MQQVRPQGVVVWLRVGHQRDLRLVQRCHVVDRVHLLRRGEVAERVEVDEVRALQRAGDAAIARTGKQDPRPR